jgi:hypothetical protein
MDRYSSRLQRSTVECPEQPRGQLQINIDMQIGTLTSIAGEPRPAVQPQQLQQRRMDSVHADMHSNQMLQNSTASSTKGRSTDKQHHRDYLRATKSIYHIYSKSLQILCD